MAGFRITSWWQWAKNITYRMLTQRADPKLIALGAAVGTFVSVLPIIPLQSVTALGLSLLVGGNRMAALGLVWISNPLFFYLDYKVGYLILKMVPWSVAPAGGDMAWHTFTMARVGEALLACLIGGVVFGLALATVAFFVTYWASVLAQNSRKQAVRAG